MTFTKIKVHKSNLKSSKELFKKRFPNEYKKVFEFLDKLSIGQINKGNNVGEERQSKYLTILPILLSYFKKPIFNLTKEDMMNFIRSLENDKIKKNNHKPYSSATKEDIKVMSRTYLKWLLPKKYGELTDWIDYKRKKKTVEYLKEQEIEKLLDNCKSISEKFLIAVLFDSGCRIEEFLNLRFEDIQEPTETFPYYKLDFKEEYSKTKGRIIGLYWKNSTKIVKNYLDECKDKIPKKPVFNLSYDATRMFLTRLGKKVLKKRLYARLFRKSSATHYAPLVNRQELCYRYGWAFSSDVPDIYISRAGMVEDRLKDKMLNVDLVKLEKRNQELETQIAIMRGDQNKTAKEMVEVFTKFQELKDIITNKRFGKKFITGVSQLSKK